MVKTRTKEEINNKIKKGTVKVFTVQELKEKLKNNEKIEFNDVDIVTTGTCGVMSGTAAIFHMPISAPGLFKKAKKIYLNGVEGHLGPCPNEWLGSVDFFVHGTDHSRYNSDYGGGFLFKDLVQGNLVHVEVESIEGKHLESFLTIDDFPDAHMIGTRMAFKNYNSFTNPDDDKEGITSIFAQPAMEGNLKEFTFSGCGELNPLQNDPQQKVIKYGSKVYLNGSEGLILANGTRSNPKKTNLMLSADMKTMHEKYLGGFKTSVGPEVFDTVGIPIPILDEKILENFNIVDEDIPLPIAHIKGRHLPLGKTNYGKVWAKGYDERPEFNSEKCIKCKECLVEKYCPTNAFFKGNISDLNCFGCGLCGNICLGNAFSINTGVLKDKINGVDEEIPIVLRQSDRKRAGLITDELKDKIENGEFLL